VHANGRQAGRHQPISSGHRIRVLEQERDPPPYARVVRRLLSAKLIALHVLGVVATTSAVLLGLWQYDAWQAGRAMAARDLTDVPPAPLDAVLASDATFQGTDVGRPVRFSGQWLPEATLLVDRRQHGSAAGMWVVTPVAVCDSPGDCAGAPAILVVRGRVSAPNGVPAPPTGRVRVTGWLQPSQGSGVPDPDPRDKVLPELRIASALQHLDQDLYGGFVIAEVSTGSATGEDGSTTGLEPVTPASMPEPDSSTSLRNLLYALEWWVFGGFAAFLWWRWVKDELAARDADAAHPAAEAGDREHDPEDAGIVSRS
jgi:surfeit locus 1 family protein